MIYTIEIPDALARGITAAREAENAMRTKFNQRAERAGRPTSRLVENDQAIVQSVVVNAANQFLEKYDPEAAIDAKIAALQERKDKLTKAKPVEAAAER